LRRQSGGEGLNESRTHLLLKDVTLGCAGAAYGLQDVPLTIDLPGDRRQIRCYFIADGRQDPYGKKKYETGSARHMKALHLAPFWAGAQNFPFPGGPSKPRTPVAASLSPGAIVLPQCCAEKRRHPCRVEVQP